MGFSQLLQSLDDLLFEVLSWLIFYPITLWRTLTRPLRMMDYSARELTDAEEDQFEDTLSPPVFLFVSVLLASAVALELRDDGAPLGLSQLLSDQGSVVLFRLLVFAVFPLMMSVRLLQARRERLTRASLRTPFYSQCYAAAPFALVLDLGASIVEVRQPWAIAVGLVMAAVALLAFGLVQSLWFARQLDRSLLKGFGHASLAILSSILVLALFTPLID